VNFTDLVSRLFVVEKIVFILVMIFPVTLGAPLMIVAVPPSVVSVPAAFPLGVQITPTLIRLVASFAMLANCLIQLRFPPFDFPLTLGMVVGVQLGHGDQRGRA
jgi:hypothetical protein